MSVLRHTNTTFALYPYKLDAPCTLETVGSVTDKVLKYAVEHELCPPGTEAVVLSGTKKADADGAPRMSIAVAPGAL